MPNSINFCNGIFLYVIPNRLFLLVLYSSIKIISFISYTVTIFFRVYFFIWIFVMEKQSPSEFYIKVFFRPSTFLKKKQVFSCKFWEIFKNIFYYRASPGNYFLIQIVNNEETFFRMPLHFLPTYRCFINIDCETTIYNL